MSALASLGSRRREKEDSRPGAERLVTSAATNSASLKLISPSALMAIKNLELRARIVVEGFWHGIHRSPYHGFSVEFTEYRQYSPGDDPRYLDWRLFARSDRYYIKKFEDETNLRCYLLVDHSRSMDYGSLGWTKSTNKSATTSPRATASATCAGSCCSSNKPPPAPPPTSSRRSNASWKSSANAR
jgi:hypothetical protein